VDACKFYLEFLVQVIGSVEVEFPDIGSDPVATAKAYVAGRITEAEYRSDTAAWWEYLESTGSARDLQAPETLPARLALCLLGATTDQADQLGEHLSWFLQFLWYFGVSYDVSIPKLNTYFGIDCT
jgi:hypothetical protein